MRHRLASAVGALALGWLAGPGWAADPVASPVGGDASKPTLSQNSTPALTGGDYHGEACPEGCAGRGHILAGAGFYYLKAFPHNDHAYFTQERNFPPGPIDVVNDHRSQTDFHHNYEFATLIWLGYVGEGGLGARV